MSEPLAPYRTNEGGDHLDRLLAQLELSEDELVSRIVSEISDSAWTHMQRVVKEMGLLDDSEIKRVTDAVVHAAVLGVVRAQVSAFVTQNLSSSSVSP